MFLGISPGTPNSGTPFSYHSQTSRGSYGSGVSVVWVAGGVPLLRSFWNFPSLFLFFGFPDFPILLGCPWKLVTR